MKFDQLEHVVETARTGSISQASNNLFLSQSSLSLSIKTLEEELGEAIFVRTNKGVSLTPFGKEFLSYASAILLQMKQLTSMKKRSQHSGLRLSVANIGFRFVTDACARLYRAHQNSGIQIHLYDDIGYGVLDSVSDGLYEIGSIRIWSCYQRAMRKQMQMKSLQFFPLTQAPVSIVVGRGNPLFAGEPQTVRISQLQHFPLMVYAHMDAGPYSSVIDELNLPSSHDRIVVTSRASNYELLDKTDAYYVTATPRTAYQRTDYYPFARSLVLDDCKISAEIGWIKREAYNPTPLANEFIRILNGYFY